MAAVASMTMALAFALELATLAAFAAFGFRTVDHAWARWLPAICLPLGTAGLWMLFLAPKAAHRVSMGPGILLSLAIFLLGALALHHLDRSTLAGFMAAAAMLHASLAFVLRQW